MFGMNHKPVCRLFGVDDAILAAGIGALGSVAGGLIGGSSSSKSNKLAIQFAREQAQNKYQWAVKDMEKAGLNPKLAGTQAAGISSGGTPSLRDPGSHISQGIVQAAAIAGNAVQAYSSAAKNIADASLAKEQAITQSAARAQLQADAELKGSQQVLNRALELESVARASKTPDERRLLRRQADKAWAEWTRINQEASWYDDVRFPFQKFLRDNPTVSIIDQFSGSAKNYGLTLDTLLRLLPVGKAGKAAKSLPKSGRPLSNAK